MNNNTIVHKNVDRWQADKIVETFCGENANKLGVKYYYSDDLMLYFIGEPDENYQEYFAQRGKAALVIDVDKYNQLLSNI